MEKSTTEQTMLRAKSYEKQGEVDQARRLYKIILDASPYNKRAKQAITALDQSRPTVNKKGTNPPPDQLDALVLLYNKGHLSAAVEKALLLVSDFPLTFLLWNIIGAANSGLGKLAEAEVGFRKAVELNPTSAEALNNLGVNLKDQGKHEGAIAAYQRALKIKPDYAVAQYNIGTTLKKQGKLDKAIEAYQHTLKIKPDYVGAHFNIGVVLTKQGKLDEAIEAYRRVLKLKPDYAKALYNIGNVLKDQGKLGEAIEVYQHALKIRPDYAEVHYNMGVALQEQGSFEAAVEAYQHALKIKPDSADAHNNLGVTLKEQGKLEDAIQAYQRALEIKPDYADAYYNMGVTLQEQGSFEIAVEVYQHALKIKPDYNEAHLNIGNMLCGQGKLDEAIESYQRALKIKPDHAEAYNNMGNTLKDQGKLDQAIESYQRALKIKPGFAEAFFGLALVTNLKGDLIKGFELYEWRTRVNALKIRSPRDNLSWNGAQNISGKRFVVYEEQGLGDKIQFCRYLPLLVQQNAFVTFQVTSALHSLLGTLDSNVILTNYLPSEDQIDFEAPLMSLPYLFNTDLHTIPAPSPYLYADEAKIKFWAEKLHKDNFKIGICWQGSMTKVDVGRSFPLSLFEKISQISDVELISLHKGLGEDQLSDVNFNLTSFDDNFDTGTDAFIDTAAIMANCDLIITSDTAVAHLAGALGRTTWVALKAFPDWRWMLNGSKSPWYPTMTLYRQPIDGNWLDVFQTLERDLRLLMNEKGK